MTSSRDDDALGWAGDDDPTLVSGSTTTPEPADAPAERSGGGTGLAEPGSDLPEGWAVTGSPGGYVDGPVGRAPLSSSALVGLGVLGGVYLLYTIGWFIGAGRIENPLNDPLAQFMFSLGTWLAVAAPLVWFASSYWLTRGTPRLRWTWLILGVVLLAPLPFIAGTGGL
ncbi:DNA polymerase III subunit gamma/tau [Cryobacterium adonitolivorans]|uniref:DNA polymerase III subunit gamma/tau n=1 Tax=Cryobacterium adonitolivorans TaxID=1259189 RepID=A0A4R8W286_9MICO|nr:DNA polymerase III subunit gamma/tau [Cryobacterium adonitolivorans]TFC01100.1 DNA polymerase III subunit gamma/tau [Cryobacterium adonitolivorans]